LTAQIRKASPRLASLQYPEPLDIAGARRALAPGTALLAYTIGEKRSYLLVVHPSEGPRTLSVPNLEPYCPLRVPQVELHQNTHDL